MSTPTVEETLRRAARREFLLWTETPEGAAYRHDAKAEAAFIIGYLTACREWGPF